MAFESRIGTHRNCGFNDYCGITLYRISDGIAGGHQEGQISRSVGLRRSADGQKDNIGIGNRSGDIGTETESPGFDIPVQVVMNSFLINWRAPFFEHGYFTGIYIDAEYAVSEIGKAYGVLAGAEYATHLLAGLVKTATLGLGTAVTLVPQLVAGAFTTYVVGNASIVYFSRGNTWGPGGPGGVIKQILADIDRESVMNEIKSGVLEKLKG